MTAEVELGRGQDYDYLRPYSHSLWGKVIIDILARTNTLLALKGKHE